MPTVTPYQKHKKLHHKTTWYSPDGFVKIEECPKCGMRFLHHPAQEYPMVMHHYPSLFKAKVAKKRVTRKKLKR